MESILEYNNPDIPDWIEIFYHPIRDNQAIDVALMAVLILIVLDLISGMTQAWMNNTFDSTKIRQGLVHKCTELMVILIGLVLDALIFAGVDLGIGLDFNSPVTMVVCISLILMELASIMENMIKINPEFSENPIFKALAAAHIINTDNQDADEQMKILYTYIAENNKKVTDISDIPPEPAPDYAFSINHEDELEPVNDENE